MKTDNNKKNVPAVPEPEQRKELAPAVSGMDMSKADQHAMYGELGTNDITVPRLTVLQGLSPEVNEGLGRPGNLFIKGLNQELGKEIEIVPIMRSKSRIKWKPLTEGGGITCQSLDGYLGHGDPGGNCDTCSLKEWHANSENIMKPPLCDLYENVIIYLRNFDDQIPMALSGSRTKLKALKDLNTLFMSQMLKGRALYTKSYTVKVIEKKNKMNLPYFSFKVLPANNNQLLPESEVLIGQQIFESIKGKKLNIAHENEKEENSELNPEL